MRAYPFIISCVGVVVLGLANVGAGQAHVVGKNVPARPLTQDRVIGRDAWLSYIRTSNTLLEHEKSVFGAERPAGAFNPLIGSGSGARTMPLNKAASWYASAEARHIADVIVSFQTPAGGWSKNSPRNGDVRQPGQFYVSVHDAGEAGHVSWSWVNTFDNGATTTELQFLARVAAATPGHAGEPYRDSFVRGLAYVFAAQFPNGGWPQVFPLEGSYHDAITYNDNAMVDILALLVAAGDGQGDFEFVPEEYRVRSRAAVARGIECILATQIRIDNVPTVWGQQYDALEATPAGARNYEPPSLSSAESAGILLFLMSREAPSPEIVASVHRGIAWLKAAALHDSAWTKGPNGYHIEAQPGAPLLWARYYSLETGRPIFGDRDLSIHDDVSDISAERRDGYAWYNTGSQKALDAYESWRLKHPEAN